MVSCWPYRPFAAFVVLWHYSLGYSLQFLVKMSSGIRFINIRNISSYLVFSTFIRVRRIFAQFLCKRKQEQFLWSVRRVFMFDSICIQASILLACFHFSKHPSNFPVFRKLTNANLRHVKEKEKRHVQKKTLSPWVSTSVNLFYEEVLVKENVRPWLADRLQQFTHFPLIQNQSSVGSGICVRRKWYLSVVVSTVIYKSLSTTGLCTHQHPFQGLLKLEISVFVLRISLHTLTHKTNRKKKKQ